jgi:hypothetical protein
MAVLMNLAASLRYDPNDSELACYVLVIEILNFEFIWNLVLVI